MADQLSIQSKLQQCLGPEWISSRAGHGGSKLMYLEGKTSINLANEIFGYDGWSSEVRDSQVDFIDVGEDKRYSVAVATTVRITLKDGTFHEDIGYGMSENNRSKAAAFEKARKESATDGMKRALRMFGNAVGNCIYDKSYLRNVGNMGRPAIPFIPLDLYRHPHIRKSIEEQMKQSAEQSTATTVTPQPPRSTLGNATTSTTVQPQPPVTNKPTAPPNKAPVTSAPTTVTTNPVKMEPTPAKRQYADDFGPELFAEDSFIIDDEDDEFYAQIAETDYHSPPALKPNNQPPVGNDQGSKRQRQ